MKLSQLKRLIRESIKEQLLNEAEADRSRHGRSFKDLLMEIKRHVIEELIPNLIKEKESAEVLVKAAEVAYMEVMADIKREIKNFGHGEEMKLIFNNALKKEKTEYRRHKEHAEDIEITLDSVKDSLDSIYTDTEAVLEELQPYLSEDLKRRLEDFDL